MAPGYLIKALATILPHACCFAGGKSRYYSVLRQNGCQVVRIMFKQFFKFVSLLGAIAMMSPSNADSVRAECGFSATADTLPGETSACTFSQRQGYVDINVDGGPSFSFSPTDQAPGNYTDAEGEAVYRQSGLGEAGVIFKLPDRFLSVYWVRDLLSCEADAITSIDGCSLYYGRIVFNVRATNDGSVNRLAVRTTGLEGGPSLLTSEIDGAAYQAEIADLDANGWPEVYTYVSSAGSGSYGSLMAYAVNNGKSVSPIYLRPIADEPSIANGYMGHDEFAVVENVLVQRFPVYRDGDTNAEPSGGTRQLQYRLVPGEAGWLLELDRIVDY